MINVNVTGGDISQAEIDAYIAHAKEEHPDKEITGIDIQIDGEYVDLIYHWRSIPFHRIRRITGYLVETLDKFNEGKRAEESDRVKHGIAQD